MGTFMRQLYKQKPVAWGPASSVQASIFKNAEKLGINQENIGAIIPYWENAGVQAQNIITGERYGNMALSASVGCRFINTIASTQNYNINYAGKTELSVLTSLKLNGGSTVTSVGFCDTKRTTDYDSTKGFAIKVCSQLLFKVANTECLIAGAGLNETNKYFLAFIWKSGVEQLIYVDRAKKIDLLAASYSSGLIYANSFIVGGYYDYTINSIRRLSADVDYVYLFYSALNNAQRTYIQDNPYFLLQRVPPVFYSVPGGAITITTSLDGKVIIRTATAALLDCMTSIKNDANNIFDCDAVISTTKTDAIDCKSILKSVASSVFDSKASVLSVASLLLDGKAIVSDTGSALFDVKGTVKDSAYDLVDGKSIIKSMNTALLDGKSIFLSAGTTVIDGKIIVNADGFSSSLLDGKISIKSVATNYLDGLIYIGNAADKNIDGKAIIKSSVGLTIDGKTTIQDVASNLLDGSASILTSIANIVDGKIIISDAAIGLLDGEAVILDDSSIILDGKVFLSSGSEINIFDGKITLSVPIVGKVTVSFSMRSPSVIFSIKYPAATFSIN
jgi:hypothetical protein